MAVEIPRTGEPINGRIQAVQVGEYVLNCTDDVPLKPSQAAPSVETQTFQGGDYRAVTGDGSYGDTVLTCEYNEEAYEAFDQNRADVTPVACVLPKFTGQGIPYISDAPTIVHNGTRIPQMTVTIVWITTKAPTASGAGA